MPVRPVFMRVRNGYWAQQAYLKASNTESHDRFGSSVSIFGDTALVGAAGEDPCARNVINGNGHNDTGSCRDAGAVYAFVRDGNGQWTQTAYIKHANTDLVNSGIGAAARISNQMVILGSASESSCTAGIDRHWTKDTGIGVCTDAGAAYVYSVRVQDPRTRCWWHSPCPTVKRGLGKDVDLEHDRSFCLRFLHLFVCERDWKLAG
eukprot:g51335.t1